MPAVAWAEGMPGRIVLVLLLLLGGGGAGAGPATVVRSLAVETAGAGARVRLGLGGAPAGEVTHFHLLGPERLVLDIAGARAERREVGGAGPVRAARIAQFDPGTVRVVVEGQGSIRLAGARLAARPEGGAMLELDVEAAAAADFADAVRRGRATVALSRPDQGPLAEIAALLDGRTAPPGTPAMVPAEAVRRARSRPVVVLDPGHGGRDVGAIAVTGGHEKDVTLAVARAAARALERSGRVEVRLTRSDDRFLPLGQRVALARAWGASLFISIHADSAPNPEARGASVYTLSETASDREAARLAAKENRADAIAGRDLSAVDGEAQGVLIDLALRDSMNASADFAQLLQRRMEPEGIRFRSQFHRFAGFQVLRNLGVPAVLLECGYLSNAEDAAFLFTAEGQRRLGEGIARAAEAWLTGS